MVTIPSLRTIPRAPKLGKKIHLKKVLNWAKKVRIWKPALLPQEKKTSRSNKTEEPIDKIIPEEEEKEEFILIQDNMTVIFKRV